MRVFQLAVGLCNWLVLENALKIKNNFYFLQEQSLKTRFFFICKIIFFLNQSNFNFKNDSGQKSRNFLLRLEAAFLVDARMSKYLRQCWVRRLQTHFIFRFEKSVNIFYFRKLTNLICEALQRASLLTACGHNSKIKFVNFFYFEIARKK